MPVEVRYQGEGKTRHIDEIVASSASVHIEQMDDAVWSLAIEDFYGTVYHFCLSTESGRGKVVVLHQWTASVRAALKEAEG